MRSALILALILASSAEAAAPSPEFFPVSSVSAAERKELGTTLANTFFSFTDCRSLGASIVNDKPVESDTLSRFDLLCVTDDLKCELLTPDKSGDLINHIEFTEFSSSNDSFMLRGDNGAMTVRLRRDSRATAMNTFVLPVGNLVRICKGKARAATKENLKRWLKAGERLLDK